MKRFKLAELYLAKITAVRMEHSKTPSDKRLYCDIELDNGNLKENVPFSSSSVDETTGKTHGIIYAPAKGQIVRGGWKHHPRT